MQIYEEVSKAAETESVYVRLYNLVHTCESLRGAQSEDGAFTTEYYGGAFDNPETRKQVKAG
jgi:GTP cyclohydrolase I